MAEIFMSKTTKQLSRIRCMDCRRDTGTRGLALGRPLMRADMKESA